MIILKGARPSKKSLLQIKNKILYIKVELRNRIELLCYFTYFDNHKILELKGIVMNIILKVKS